MKTILPVSGKKKMLWVLTVAGLVSFLSRCMHNDLATDPRGPAYAGSGACARCHQSTVDSYLHTAHFKSTSPASSESIEGSFSKDSNQFRINDSVKIVMEKRGGRSYQILYVRGVQKEAEPFDIVFGNVKGQSYLYWKKDLLFQLPLSYFSALHSWTSSPGYPAGSTDYDRTIGENCFECHSSYIRETVSDSTTKKSNALDKKSLIYPIDCERCHGPAANHVKFQEAFPDQKGAHYIVSYKNLTRAQRIDQCAVCHSGTQNTVLRSTFGFKPGDSLEGYMQRMYSVYEKPDVHANQSLLLAQSKCYISSNLDCETCHDVHVKDRGNYTAYAAKCANCHSIEKHTYCKITEPINLTFLKNNCTRCHMPSEPSSAIQIQPASYTKNIPCNVVTHRIAVYPMESKTIMHTLNERK